MIYTFMNKNVAICKLDINLVPLQLNACVETYNLDYLPYDVRHNETWLNLDDLSDWLDHRKQPDFRQELIDLLLKLHISDIKDIALKNYGLNVIDQYWFCPEGEDLSWAEINYFDNPISTDLGKVIFNYQDNVSAWNSADMLTDGWLRKTWIKHDGEIALLKQGTLPYNEEVQNEVLASIICDLLNFSHVKFTEYKVGAEVYSYCPNLVNKDTELIKIGEFIKHKPELRAQLDFETLVSLCEGVGISDARQRFADIIVLDYLIANTDRHLRNFGLVRDVNTLEFIGVAPIYDNGSAMYMNIADDEVLSAQVSAQPFASTHKEQIKLVDINSYDFSKLDDIEDIVREVYTDSLIDKANPVRKDILAKAVRQRIEELKALQN